MVPERLSQHTAVKEHTSEQGTSESEVPPGDMHPGHHVPPPPLLLEARTALFLILLTSSAEVELKSWLVIFF